MHETLQEASKPVSNPIASQSGLSHTQVQIWTAQAVHPESPFCNMAFAFTINGPIDSLVFKKAWQIVVDSSDALRTSIAIKNGAPNRRELPLGSCPLQVHDFSTEADPESCFRIWAGKCTAVPFELSGELLSSHLCKLGEARYVWFLNQHHLVTDAHSTSLVFNAVAAKYQSLLSSSNEALLPTPSYYKTISGLERLKKKDSGGEVSNPPATQPRNCSLYGRKGIPSATQSKRLSLSLSTAQSEKLRSLADDPVFANLFSDVSLFSIFNVALAAFVYRVSEQSSFGIDAPAANRSSQEARNTIGCFIEMFPLDCSVEPTDTFRTLAERLQPEIHSYLSKVGPGRSEPSASHASNIVLNFYPGSFGNFCGYETDVEWIHSDHIDGVNDLKLQVHDLAATGHFTFQFDLSSDTLPERILKRIPQHFETLLVEMLENLDTPIDSVDLLTTEERQSLLIQYNKPSNSKVPSDTVIERIEAQVLAKPDTLALTDPTGPKLTYRELWQTVERIATLLQKLGVSRESPVAIAMNRSADAVIATLAIQRAGGAFVPIDLTSPTARQKSILADCSPSLILVSDLSLVSKYSDSAPTYDIVSLNRDPGEALHLSPPSPNDLAYIIYTSGSTGTPKGVEIEHRGLIDYIDWAERSYVRGDTLSFPLFTSLSFDLTITSLFLPFITGGTLHVYPQRIDEVDSAIIDVINENKVDFVKLTPSHLSLLRKLDLSQSRISRLVLGGEDLKTSLADSIMRHFGKTVDIYNEYGPTECVVGCMIHRYDPSQKTEHSSTSVPIGKPADHVSLYVLNGQQIPVQEGTPGELYVARDGMARGYRNDEAKNRLAFIDLPRLSPKRLYRTGDLVRFSSKEELTYLGRLDKQVKIRGHRIELGEIENALLSLPEISEVFVTVKTNAKTEPSSPATAYCTRCGIASNYPNIAFNEVGVCSVCDAYESIKETADSYFQDRTTLRKIFSESREANHPSYDCMVFFSGGKDSAYALANLVDLGLKVYAFTLDNGYLSDQAMSNISRVVDALAVDHEFATTPAMNEIFRDSLTRYSNVCNGCFKTIYTLGIQRAVELDIPIIVTGLSRGQFYETRLTQNLFKGNLFSPEDVDTAVLEARKRYHRENDAVAACLDTTLFETDQVFEKVRFIDFYRYWDAPLEDIYAYLEKRLPWIRPSDTGRSTNCRVNDVGIYIHKKERGFHNYALPYSWDVRLGQKKREEAIEELDDHYDLQDVRKMLSEIGYDEDRLEGTRNGNELRAYYVASNPLPSKVLSKHLNHLLPSYMVPSNFEPLDSLPLTANGKVDEAALVSIHASPSLDSDFIMPEGPVEEHVSSLWEESLSVSNISSNVSYFQYGGTSLGAMEIAIQLCRDFEIDLPLQSIFQHSTVSELSSEIERLLLEEIESLSEEEANEMLKKGGNE